jgi:hypothetical protein
LNPKEVDHIRISAERGYGPLDLEDIEITGDVSLDQAHECAKGLRLTTKRIEEIFNNRSNITTYVGPPPEMYDYCWGGCPGSLFEAMQIIEIFQPNVYHEIKRMHIVLGSYEGEIRAQSDEPVLFVGDCAVWEGTIKGQPVKIPFLYKQRNQHNPYTAKSGDVVMKMIGVIRNLIRYREQAFIRVKGCPVSVAENVHYLSWTGKVTNPYFHPKILYKFIYYWSVSKIVRLWRRMTTPKSGMLKS